MNKQFDRKVVNLGFMTALLLAGICLVASAFYLYTYMKDTNASMESMLKWATSSPIPQEGQNAATDVPPEPPSPEILKLAITARVTMARFTLLSCGVFVGLAFGFLGFALFLLGITNEMDATAEGEGYSIKLARLSPGVFVILCATVLIGVCMTRRTAFELTSAPEQHISENTPHETPPPQSATGTQENGDAGAVGPKTDRRPL